MLKLFLIINQKCDKNMKLSIRSYNTIFYIKYVKKGDVMPVYRGFKLLGNFKG